jgi:hypothetical protein
LLVSKLNMKSMKKVKGMKRRHPRGTPSLNPERRRMESPAGAAPS